MNRELARQPKRPNLPAIAAPASGPLLAVVVPVYKHSVLLAEAVISALNQQTDFELFIVIVNDGCPMPETHQACLDFAAAAPDRVHYIRRPNGGLSAARNTGIDYVLGTWETVQAIYFLDADNRLLSGALQRAYDVLVQDPEIGWIYPNIDMFGREWNGDFSGEYSVLRHLEENMCEAGSLVRRAVFEKGARFDETMTLGFEDWDFWLSAIELGFRGKHLNNFGFQYRKRAESMLRDSERDRPEITAYIRRKHKDLFRFGQLMALEHQEAPRYGICIPGTGQIFLTSDPNIDGREISQNDFFAEYYRAKSMPSRYSRPAFIVVIDQEAKHRLHSQGLLRWIFWYFETLIDNYHFVYLRFASSIERDSIEILDVAETARPHAHEAAGILMVKTALLDKCLDDPLDNWVMSLSSSHPQPKTHVVEVALPDQGLFEFSANAAFLELFQELRRFGARLCLGASWEWRISWGRPKPDSFQIARKMLDASPLYPRLSKAGQRQIGFLLPIAEFGGVEKTAYNLARVLRDKGWATHLFVFGRQSCKPSAEISGVFASLNFLCDPGVGSWDAENRFMGSHYTHWAASGRHERAMGMLSGLDAIVNCHSADANALMGPLRRRGTTTVASLQVTDLTQWDRPNGHTYLTLGYEHAYDLITCCSQQLMDWCHGMGVPERKLSLLLNAPSYHLPAAAIKKAVATRRMRELRPLRVMYLGRFDRQKGLDRLTAIVRSSRDAGLPVQWRVIGASVIGDAGQQELEQLSVSIEPAKLTPEELTDCYCWADVILLVSRWEGLPLTILEAMRLGVVVCATAVGAVAEAVSHNETGFLLPSASTRTISNQAVKILQSLCSDRGLLERLSSSAAEAAEGWTWEKTAQDFITQLDRLTPA
jgi:glycosyltransferase involved in cell wall biosynthesis